MPKLKSNIIEIIEGNDEGREVANLYWVDWAKLWSWNDENVIDFRWSDVQVEDEEDITLGNFIKNYKNKQMRKVFAKINLMIAIPYLIKRKTKKIFLKIISNIKIFNIKFFQ